MRQLLRQVLTIQGNSVQNQHNKPTKEFEKLKLSFLSFICFNLFSIQVSIAQKAELKYELLYEKLNSR